VRIVFPAKRDLIILERHQSMVGDGDAVRIASEIVQNMLGTGRTVSGKIWLWVGCVSGGGENGRVYQWRGNSPRRASGVKGSCA
jgi:hypothetical protein